MFNIAFFMRFVVVLAAAMVLSVVQLYAQTGALHPKAVDDTILVSQKNGQLHNILVNDYISFDYKQTRITIIEAAKAKLEVRNDKGLDKIWYEPDYDDPENDRFVYQICDEQQQCDMATVIVIKCPPGKPAFPQMVEKIVLRGSALNFDYPGCFIKVSKEPTAGKLVLSEDGSAADFKLEKSFTGTVNFAISVYKDNGVCGIQFQEAVNMKLHFIPAEKDNRPPNAADDFVTTKKMQPVTIEVLENDSDPDDTLEPKITKVTLPANGKIKRTTKNITYTANSGFTGTDTFTYTVCDYNDACSTATVTVEVTK